MSLPSPGVAINKEGVIDDAGAGKCSLGRRIGEIIKGPDHKGLEGVPGVQIIVFIDVKLLKREFKGAAGIPIFFNRLPVLIFYNKILDITELIGYITDYL
jgi:hypothetical protein